MDDIAAIKAAIDSCPPEHAVLLPAGTYLTTGTLVISKSVVLRGAGPDLTHIMQDSNRDAINIISGGDRAGIEDLHVHTSWPDFNEYGGMKIHFIGVQNSWVRNIETSGYSAHTVSLLSSSHCEVRDSYFHLNPERRIPKQSKRSAPPEPQSREMDLTRKEMKKDATTTWLRTICMTGSVMP